MPTNLGFRHIALLTLMSCVWQSCGPGVRLGLHFPSESVTVAPVSQPRVAFQSKAALDGSTSAIPAADNIWLVRADGSERTALTRNTLSNLTSYYPSFSPDGAKIVFASRTALNGSWDGTATGSLNIWSMNADGSNRTALTQNTASSLNSYSPVFSPDGKKIAFYSTTALDGSWDGAAAGSFNIWVMNADGSGRTALTRNTATSLSSYYPSFSPDSAKIAFGSFTALDGGWDGLNGGASGSASGSSNIWVMNVDGSGRTPLTQNTSTSLGSYSPGFSPDGTKIVFHSFTSLDGGTNGSATGSSNIWIMNTDGSGRTALTQNANASLSSSYPRFIPTGTIIFQSRTALDGAWNGTAANDNIWIMSGDGASRIALTQAKASGAPSSLPVASSDGALVVFRSYLALDGSANSAPTYCVNTWAMKADGTAKTALTKFNDFSLEGVNGPPSVAIP